MLGCAVVWAEIEGGGALLLSTDLLVAPPTPLDTWSNLLAAISHCQQLKFASPFLCSSFPNHLLFVLSLFIFCGLSSSQSFVELIWWFCFARGGGGGGLSHKLRRECRQAKQRCVKLWHSNNISFLASLIMFVSFLSLICRLFACCLGLACSSSYPCPLFFLPSHPCLRLSGCLSKSLLLCAFSCLSLVFLYGQERRRGVRNRCCSGGLYHGREGGGGPFLCFGCRFFVELCLMALSIVCMVFSA